MLLDPGAICNQYPPPLTYFCCSCSTVYPRNCKDKIIIFLIKGQSIKTKWVKNSFLSVKIVTVVIVNWFYQREHQARCLKPTILGDLPLVWSQTLSTTEIILFCCNGCLSPLANCTSCLVFPQSWECQREKWEYSWADTSTRHQCWVELVTSCISSPSLDPPSFK